MLIKKFGSMLLALTLMLSCIPGTMVSAAEAAWFDIEVEEGQPDTEPLLTNKDGRGCVYTVQGTPSATKTTSSFTRESEGTFDVWAVIGRHDNGNNLCSYTFNLDGTDLKNISATIGGEAIYTGTYEVAAGHKMTMVWAKVAGSVAVSAGAHSLVAEISAAGNGNKCGQMDLVRFVPSSWNWKPGANFDAPVENSAAGWLHVEAEEGLVAGNLNTNTWASGGAAVIAVEANQTSESNTTINIPSATNYDIYAVIGLPWNDKTNNNRGGYEFSIDGGAPFYKKYAAEVVAANDGIFNNAWLTNDEYKQDVKWVKIGSSVALTAGSHSLTSKITKGQNNTLGVGVIDCIRFVPSSWNWVPSGANYDAPVDNSAAGWLHFEAEDGLVAGNLNTNTWASGGAAVIAVEANQTSESNKTINIPSATNYDIYAVIGLPWNDKTNNNRGGYEFSIDGTVFYKKYAAEVVAANDGIFNNDWLTNDEYKQDTKWVKIGSSVALTAGSHSFTSKITKGQDGTMGVGVIDCIRIVPSSWNWVPTGANYDAPTSTPTPAPSDKLVEYTDFAIVKEGSRTYAQVTGIKTLDANNAKTAVVILAVYQNDTLIGVYPSAVTPLTSAGQNITTGTATIPTGATLKAFLWNDLNTAMPYAEPAV